MYEFALLFYPQVSFDGLFAPICNVLAVGLLVCLEDVVALPISDIYRRNGFRQAQRKNIDITVRNQECSEIFKKETAY